MFATAIAFDATRGQVIAAAILANNNAALVGLNPADLSTLWTLPISSPASALAVSDDGSALYAGLISEAAIQQIDLSTQSPVRKFAIADPNSGAFAFDIAVRPGAPDTIAAAIGTDILVPTAFAPTLFVQGVPQPTSGFPLDGRAPLIAFADANTLVTLDDETTQAGVENYTVTDTGLTYVSTSSGHCCGSFMSAANGKIFLSNGEFIDPGTLGTTKSIGGTHILGDYFFLSDTNTVVAVGATAAANSRVSVVVSMEEYDTDRGTLKRLLKTEQIIPGASVLDGVLADLIKVVPTGPGRLAVLVADDFSGSSVLLSVDLSAVPPLQPRSFPAQAVTSGSASVISIPAPFFSYAYDPTGNRVLATLEPYAGPQGNSLAVIKADDGTVERIIPLSSEPREVYASPTGSIAYVALPREHAVQQIDVGSGTLGPKMTFEIPVPSSIAVKPDDPQTIAIADGGGQIVLVYRDGVKVGQVASAAFPRGTFALSTVVAFNSSTELLGFDTISSNSSIQHYSYDSSGLAPVSTKSFVIDGFTRPNIGFGYAYGPFSLVDIKSDTQVGRFVPGSTEFSFFGATLLTSPTTGIGTSSISTGTGQDPVFEQLTQNIQPDDSLVYSGQSRIRLHDPRFNGLGSPLISAGANRFLEGQSRFDGGDGVIYIFSAP